MTISPELIAALRAALQALNHVLDVVEADQAERRPVSTHNRRIFEELEKLNGEKPGGKREAG